MNEELLSALRYELGEVTGWEELCPAVYSLTVQPDPDSVSPCSEYYLALPGAPISREALALGRALDGIPGLLYAIDPPDEGGWTAILYELCKNQSRHGSPPLEGWSLADAAMEGMELCPSYFGSFPVLPYTPWGWTLRYPSRPMRNSFLGASICPACSPAVCRKPSCEKILLTICCAPSWRM